VPQGLHDSSFSGTEKMTKHIASSGSTELLCQKLLQNRGIGA
jgi:hypothetical protein